MSPAAPDRSAGFGQLRGGRPSRSRRVPVDLAVLGDHRAGADVRTSSPSSARLDQLRGLLGQLHPATRLAGDLGIRLGDLGPGLEDGTEPRQPEILRRQPLGGEEEIDGGRFPMTARPSPSLISWTSALIGSSSNAGGRTPRRCRPSTGGVRALVASCTSGTLPERNLDGTVPRIRRTCLTGPQRPGGYPAVSLRCPCGRPRRPASRRPAGRSRDGPAPAPPSTAG